MRTLFVIIALVLMPSLAKAACPAAPVGSAQDRVIQMVAGGDNQTQMGSDAVVNATEEGAIVYDATNKAIAVCDGTNWVHSGGGGGGGGGGGEPPLTFEINAGNQTSNYVCKHDVDLESYCGDDDGCRIVLNMNHKNEQFDMVRTITEHIYMEQPSFSSNRKPDIYGWTRQEGGGDYSWRNGANERYTIFNPWDWVYAFNYKSNTCGGNYSIYSDPYTFTFMTSPVIRARITVYDSPYSSSGGGNIIGTFAESPQLSFSNNGQYSWTHGQGSTPKFFQAVLVAIVSNNGYAVGDEIAIGASGLYRRTDGITNTVGASSTEIWLSTAISPPLFADKGGSTRGTANSSQWRLVLRGWW